MTSPHQPGSSADPARRTSSTAHEVAVTDDARDPRSGPDGRTARVTLTSILLGAIVAALVSALPPTPAAFVTNVLRADHLLVDLRVIVLLVAAFNMWLQYSWSVILRLVPFDFLSNLLSFLQAVTMIGAALSVSDGRAWFAWCAAALAMVTAAYLSMRHVRAVQVVWWRIALTGAATLLSAFAALTEYRVPPAATPPLLWVALITVAVIADLAAFARFLQTLSPAVASGPASR